MQSGFRILLAWERGETNSWNPVLADLLRARGDEVEEVHDLASLRGLDLRSFDVCLPRFRVGCAAMARLDEELVVSGVPMVNSRESRRVCENKALAHLAFERAGIPQPASVVMDREGTLDARPAWQGETAIKPLHGNRGAGIEIAPSPAAAEKRARERQEDLLLQEMIWPARCWRVIAGRCSGAVDPYWRRPLDPDERVLSISAGAEIVRDPAPAAVEAMAVEMTTAVDGDLLAADILERDGEAWALEINHNFDAHGGDAPAIAALRTEISERLITAAAV